MQDAVLMIAAHFAALCVVVVVELGVKLIIDTRDLPSSHSIAFFTPAESAAATMISTRVRVTYYNGNEPLKNAKTRHQQQPQRQLCVCIRKIVGKYGDVSLFPIPTGKP